MRATGKILALAAAHFVVGFLVFGVSYSLGMDRFDHGGEPTTVAMLSDAGVNILWFPFLPIAQATGIHGGGFAEWLLFFGNSLLWGVSLYFLLTAVRHLFTRPVSPPTA